MNYELINTNICGDDRGHLIVFEKNMNCPFDVKRIFYIYGTNGKVARGCHANRNSEFLLISINGNCKVKIDDGKTQKIVELSNPHTALYLDKMLWKEMYDFSADCILLVIASTNYDEREYIRDYEEFLKEVNG